MDPEERAMQLQVLQECLKSPEKQPRVAKPGSKPVPSVSPNWRQNPAYKPKAETHSARRVVAIDCEMVSTDSNPNTLARVSIVDFDGNVVLDEYVKTKDKVRNYKTAVSGIKPSHLKFAKSFEEVQETVSKLLEGCTVVGHAISHDLQALDIVLPSDHVADTQKLYKLSHGVKAVSLKKLVEAELGRSIQEGEHDSVQDARATMEIYRKLFIMHTNSQTKERTREVRKRKETSNIY
jgi:RNA exonuclease 4